MKVTLRDIATVVATVAVVGFLIWCLNIKRWVDNQNDLVEALVEQIQIQNDSLRAGVRNLGPPVEP